MTDTAQRRAEAFVDQMLTFIEKTSRRKLRFLAIVDMGTGTQTDPTQRHVSAIMERDKQTRREALEEAAKVISEYNLSHDHGKNATKACDDIAEMLDRLREGQ